jgi:hypothetical protein
MDIEGAKPESKLSALAGRVGSAGARVMASPRLAPILLLAVLVWEFGLLILQASQKRFWYDELLTLHISGLQPLSAVWRALKAGVDAMTLGYYLFIRAARLVRADPHIALRLPSILGYVLTLLGVYWFARKRLTPIAGLAAALLIALSPFRDYAMEARSYGLLVGFFAIATVFWQRIGEKRFMTPLFAASLTLAVSCHYVAVVALSCFGLAELTWSLLSRRIRWGVWAACVLAASPFFFSLPVLMHFREALGKHYWSRPGWSVAIRSYSTYVGLDNKLALVLILFFGMVVGNSLLRTLRGPKDGMPKRRSGLPDIVLTGGLLFYPALLFVLVKLLGSGYAPRYGWPGILGLALGAVYLVRTVWRTRSSTYLLVALLVAFAVQGGSDFWTAHKASPAGVDRRWTELAELSRGEPGIPVAIGSPEAFLEAVEYSPPELRGRLVEVVDEESALRLAGADSVDRGNRLLAQFIPVHVEDLAAFQAAYPKFLVRSGGPWEWLAQYLIERRYRLTLLSKDADSSVYLAER